MTPTVQPTALPFAFVSPHPPTPEIPADSWLGPDNSTAYVQSRLPLCSPIPPMRGARQNNLRNLDLDLPLGELVVITERSGPGKSSLAFSSLSPAHALATELDLMSVQM